MLTDPRKTREKQTPNSAHIYIIFFFCQKCKKEKKNTNLYIASKPMLLAFVLFYDLQYVAAHDI